MKAKGMLCIVLLGLLIAGGAAWWWGRSTSSGQKMLAHLVAGDRQGRQVPVSSAPHPTVANDLDELVSSLALAKDSETVRRLLAELKESLDALPREIASRKIQAFLASGKDAATRIDMTISPGGGLGGASSLRVFLLDYVGQIDRPAAGAIAIQVLSQYTTPDEWAICLRNYAWANPTELARPYLEAKVRELLANKEWLNNPTAGFLEAFDTIVYAHATGLTDELAALVRDGASGGTAHAAYLTLDRLTIAEPAPMLRRFVERPELLEGHERTRANFMARADVRELEQRELIAKYLLDSSRTQEELATFAGIYPNANYMISNNLLTELKTPGAGELPASDREALKVVEEWQRDPRFEKLKSVLDQIHQRLSNFVRQADQAGH